MTLPNPAQEPTVSVPKAGRLLGIGKDNAYAMVAAGTFPVPVLALGERPILRVPTAPLLALLGLRHERSGPEDPLPIPLLSATTSPDDQSGGSRGTP